MIHLNQQTALVKMLNHKSNNKLQQLKFQSDRATETLVEILPLKSQTIIKF